MELKTTKGKWIYNKELQQHSGYRIIVSESNKIIHKSQNKNGLSEDEIEANAKLIAAAPEMYKSIAELISFCEFHGYNHSTEINNAREVLKKATL